MEYLVLAVVGAGIFVILGIPAFPFFAQWLSEENICFTTVKEGTAKAIMRGAGSKRFIMAFAGYHLNDPHKPKYYDRNIPDWEVVYHGDKRGLESKDDYYDDRPNWLKGLGLFFIGIYPFSNVYVYEFEWNEPVTDKKSGEERILPRKAATDFIFVKDFTYAMRTRAETKDRLPIDATALVTVAIRNVYRALFSGEDWLLRTTSVVNRLGRFFIGAYDYQYLINPDAANPDQSEISQKYSKPIIGLTEKLPDDINDEKKPWGLHGRYGVVIRSADLQTTDFSGEGAEKYQEAASKAYVAQQEAKSIELVGQAKANVVRINGEEEAKALEARLTVLSKHGPMGIELARLDAMQASAQGSGNTVIWANNPFGGLAETLKGVAQPTQGDAP